MLGKKQRPAAGDTSQPVLRCSFCSKDQDEVRKLIAGPTVFICDECIDVCNRIIADDAASETPAIKNGGVTNVLPDVPDSGPGVHCALCRMPIIQSDGLLIRNRGVVCHGCIGEVQAAVAERRESGL